MASGRFLSAAVSEDFRLNSLSLEAQLVYLMAIPHLDVDGIMPGHPTLVHARACPLKVELRDRMPEIIDEWVESGLVVRYDSDGEEALFFTGFPKNQRVRRDREAASRFDTPPGWIRDGNGMLVRDGSGSTPAQRRDDSGSTPTQYNTKQTNTTTTTSADGENCGGCGGAESEDSDAAIQPVIEAWGEYEMTPKATKQTAQRLRDDVTQHGAPYVLECIRIAADAGQPTMRYYRGVLRKGPDSPRASPNGTGQYAGWEVVPDEGDDDG